MLEGIIRPFLNPDVAPVPFTKPGSASVPLVHVVVGAKGGTKTFNWSASGSQSKYIGAVHKEKSPSSPSIQAKLASASS